MLGGGEGGVNRCEEVRQLLLGGGGGGGGKWAWCRLGGGGGGGGISSVKRSDSCCSRMGWGVSRCEEVRQQWWW